MGSLCSGMEAPENGQFQPFRESGLGVTCTLDLQLLFYIAVINIAVIIAWDISHLKEFDLRINNLNTISEERKSF